MTDTTMTFAPLPKNQTKVKLLEDPTQPGWEEYLAGASRHDDENRGDREGDRLFGTRIREAIRVLSKPR